MNLGAPEVFVLALLGVLLFGPEKLPEIARKVARVIRYLRGIANDARGQLVAGLGPEFAELTEEVRGNVAELRGEVEDLRADAGVMRTQGVSSARAVMIPVPGQTAPYDSEAT